MIVTRMTTSKRGWLQLLYELLHSIWHNQLLKSWPKTSRLWVSNRRRLEDRKTIRILFEGPLLRVQRGNFSNHLRPWWLPVWLGISAVEMGRSNLWWAQRLWGRSLWEDSNGHRLQLMLWSKGVYRNWSHKSISEQSLVVIYTLWDWWLDVLMVYWFLSIWIGTLHMYHKRPIDCQEYLE